MSTADPGLSQYSIYQSSIDYTVAAYGPYAASATGGNDFARDFLSGIAALYSTPSMSTITIGSHFPLALTQYTALCLPSAHRTSFHPLTYSLSANSVFQHRKEIPRSMGIHHSGSIGTFHHQSDLLLLQERARDSYEE